MEKQNRKKRRLNLLAPGFLLLLVFFVFRKDYRTIEACLSHVSIGGLLFLLGLDLVYQLLDAVTRRIMIRMRMPAFGMRQAVGVTFLGIFGNVSTFAAGIIPMQSYYLYQYGVPVGNSIGMLTLIYIFHKSTVFLYAAVMMAVRGSWMRETMPGSMRYLGPGFAVCALIVLVLLLFCTWGRLQKFGVWAIGKLPETERWREKKQIWQKNLESLYGESRNVLKNKACCIKLVVTDILKLSCLYMIPYWCIRVLNLPGPGFWEAQTLAAVMFLIAGVLPSAAGMGAAEVSFLLLFSACLGRAQATAVLVLYRIATYFFPFLISIAVVSIMRRKGPGAQKITEERKK